MLHGPLHPRLVGGALVLSLCVLAFSGPAAAQWAPPEKLSEGVGGSVVAAGETVHVVYEGGGVRYLRSTDGGDSWSPSSMLAAGADPRLTDPIAADGDAVYVVYVKTVETLMDWCCPRGTGEIYLRRSQNGGADWSAETQLTTGARAYRASLAVQGPNLQLVWADLRGGVWSIRHLRSDDGGDSWSSEATLATAVAAKRETNRPQVALEGDDVHVVWMDDRNGTTGCYTAPKCSEVFYLRSQDGGESFGQPRMLSDPDPWFGGRPDVALSGSAVVVSFDADPQVADHEQYAVVSTDGGDTWSAPQRLTVASGLSTHGTLRASDRHAHLVWHDERIAGNNEIYHRSYDASAGQWGPEERVTDALGSSTVPVAAAGAGRLHVVWADDRGGPMAVWYSRRALPGAAPSGGDNTPAPAGGSSRSASPGGGDSAASTGKGGGDSAASTGKGGGGGTAAAPVGEGDGEAAPGGDATSSASEGSPDGPAAAGPGGDAPPASRRSGSADASGGSGDDGCAAAPSPGGSGLALPALLLALGLLAARRRARASSRAAPTSC